MLKFRFRLALNWSALSFLVLVLWWPAGAQAEPYLAIQEGYKCSKCHVNMTGGGKRTDFANVYVQTRLANRFVDWRNIGKGDEEYDEDNPIRTDSKSSFFSGRLNDYIAIGADFRWLWERTETPGESNENVFNQRKQNIYLQIDLIPERVLFYTTLAGGGDAQEIFGLIKGQVMNEPYYLKVGQFFLPYGLRLQDDTAFVRAVTGFTYGTTDVGVELGFEPGPWAFHLAVSNGTGSSQETNNDKRITASAAFVSRYFRLGGSYSTNEDTDGVETDIYGLHAGAQFGRLGLLAAGDVVDDSTVEQRVGIAEINFLVVRGHNVKFSYEWHDPDVDIFENANERYSLVYEPFLTQFTQVRVGVRENDGIPQDPSENITSYFLELHLFM